MNKQYQFLSWDSDFFGFKTAKITQQNLTIKSLQLLLSSLSKEQTKLVYYFSNHQYIEQEIKTLGGELVDFKTTYKVKLKGLNLCPVDHDFEIFKYNSSVLSADLEKLSIQCGQYSRFAYDKNIKNEKFEELYKIWMQQSINKNMADEVWAAKNKKELIGVIATTQKNQAGFINLLAVDTQFRGCGIAKRLIKTAHHFFQESGISKATVVTQADNIAANNLYKSSGYHLDNVKYVYHFWL